jgi:hypothetical protein
MIQGMLILEIKKKAAVILLQSCHPLTSSTTNKAEFLSREREKEFFTENTIKIYGCNTFG